MQRVFLLLLILIPNLEGSEFKGLQFLVNILMGNINPRNSNEETVQHQNIDLGRRQTNFSFIDYISLDQREKNMCPVPENYQGHQNVELNDEHKAKNGHVKCINKSIESGTVGTVQIMQSMKEIATLLSPHGNNTKRNQIGKCVVILFYTRSCPGSVMVGPHYVALAKIFPHMTFAAIDAFKFSSLNTEFGIIGLPTVMLFHQGRPVMRFNDTQSTVNNFISFILKYTDMRSPLVHNAYVTSEDFNGPLPSKVEYDTDYYLYLAWIFIILCATYHFTKSHLYSQIIEMIKRNWRESEAQTEQDLR